MLIGLNVHLCLFFITPRPLSAMFFGVVKILLILPVFEIFPQNTPALQCLHQIHLLNAGEPFETRCYMLSKPFDLNAYSASFDPVPKMSHDTRLSNRLALNCKLILSPEYLIGSLSTLLIHSQHLHTFSHVFSS